MCHCREAKDRKHEKTKLAADIPPTVVLSDFVGWTEILVMLQILVFP